MSLVIGCLNRLTENYMSLEDKSRHCAAYNIMCETAPVEPRVAETSPAHSRR